MIYTFTLHLQMYMYTLTCTFVNAHGNYQLFIKPFFITCNSLIICNTGKPIKSDQCIQRSCDLWVIWARFCIYTNRGVKLYYHIKLSSPHFAFTPFLLNLQTMVEGVQINVASLTIMSLHASFSHVASYKFQSISFSLIQDQVFIDVLCILVSIKPDQHPGSRH